MAGFVHNFALLSAGQLATRTVSFAAVIYLTRVLGVDGFGTIAFAMGVLVYAKVVTDLGLAHLGSLEVSRGRLSVIDLVQALLGLRLFLAVVALLALVIFVLMTPIDPIVRLVTVLFGISLLAVVLDLRWVFLGEERMWPIVVADFLGEALFAIGVFSLVDGPDDIVWVPLLYLVGQLAGSLSLAWRFTLQHGLVSPGFDRRLAGGLVRRGLPIAGAGVFGMLLYNFDIVLLGIWLGTGVTGLYGAAYRVILLLTLFVVAYLTAMRPLLGRASVAGFDTIRDFVDRTLRVSSALGVGVAVGGVILAEPLIVFLFGEEYAPGAPAFQVLLTAFILLVVSRFHRGLLVAFDRQDVDMRIMMVAAAVNVSLNLVLIPAYGLTGAAWATLMAEVVLLFLAHRATATHVARVHFLRILVRSALCAVPMAVLMIASAPLHVLTRMVLGAVVYLATLFVFRVVGVHEILRALGFERLAPAEPVR